MNLKTTCDNLAARYAPANLSAPSGAVEPIKASFGQTPVSIPNTPAVYVEVDDGDVIAGSGTWDVVNHLIVNFLLAKKQGDTARVEAQRQIWLPALLAAPLGAMQLSQAGSVKSALPVRYEFAEIDAAGETFDGIRIFVDVTVREAVTFTP